MMFDPIALATNYAEILRWLARSYHKTNDVKRVLIEIFPWLADYDIRRDGNDLRWLAVSHNTELNTVFVTDDRAKAQVRDWILEYIESQGQKLRRPYIRRPKPPRKETLAG